MNLALRVAARSPSCKKIDLIIRHEHQEVEAGVDWSHYKHPLPEHVYDIYMRYWGDVGFTGE